VKVADAGGNGVAGEAVSWIVTAGGGSLSSATAITDGGGNASVTWTLGPSVGIQTVEAIVSGLVGSPVEFSATGAAAGACSSSFSNVSLPLCDGTYSNAITSSTFSSGSTIEALNPGRVRFTGSFNPGSNLTFRGIVVTNTSIKYVGSHNIYEDMSFVGGPACGNTVNVASGSYTTIRRSAIYGPGGRYQFLGYQQTGVTLEDVIIRSDGGWGETTDCNEWEPNAALNSYDSNDFICIGCILFDGIKTAGSASETLGGIGVNCHGTASGMLFENSMSINSQGGFYADGNGTCADVTVRNSATIDGARGYGIIRNVGGTTTAENFTTNGNCGVWTGSLQLVDSHVEGSVSGCSGSTSGAGATIQLNASFLDSSRWRQEMCTDAGVTRGWCGTSMTLSEYLQDFLNR